MSASFSRRQFVAGAAAAGIAMSTVTISKAADKPALLGGKKVRTKPFASWPVTSELEEKSLMEVLRSGKWFRGGGKQVERFEQNYAKLTGAKHCIATNGGTSALVASIGALGIGPGDEVIVSPYTFIATINSILMHHALPVCVDTDPETFQIDTRKIEAAITDRTVALLPVHIGGSPADLDAVMAIARKHKLPVIEDACQAVMGEWRGRKVGTYGTAGCFSFQVSKNLCSGEGGAIITSDDQLAEKFYAFHNNCRARNVASLQFAYMPTRAGNLRMTEFQGALLSAQMTRLEEQSDRRNENAKYLTTLLNEIPGIKPAKLYDGVTRSAWHLYMLRYDAAQFAGLPRDKFLQALGAEGIPSSGGYSPVDWPKFAREILGTRACGRVYSKKALDRYVERTCLPENERVCKEGVWFFQNMLLGPRSDMDQIATAVRKLQAHAGALAKR